MGKKERRKMRRKVGKNRPLIRLASGQPPPPKGKAKNGWPWGPSMRRGGKLLGRKGCWGFPLQSILGEEGGDGLGGLGDGVGLHVQPEDIFVLSEPGHLPLGELLDGSTQEDF